MGARPHRDTPELLDMAAADELITAATSFSRNDRFP
jgi:hypothetical protein